MMRGGWGLKAVGICEYIMDIAGCWGGRGAEKEVLQLQVGDGGFGGVD